MLENRSYDNILGWLYNSGNSAPYQTPPPGQQSLNGLTGNEYNLDDDGNKVLIQNQTNSTQVSTSSFSYSATTIPAVDPGEVFKEMAQQINSTTTIPSTNPYTKWPPDDTTGLMQGFVYNYQLQSESINTQDIMNFFTPEQLPVTAFLANNFAVCDSWFASLPTQTFSNRAFGHCAGPGVIQTSLDSFGLVDDAQYILDPKIYTFVEMPSIFQALDVNPPSKPNSDGANWKIYFHDYSISIMTTEYVKNIAASKTNINIGTYDNTDWGSTTPNQLSSTTTSFFDDINNINGGSLSPYSFIEPRYSNTYCKDHGGNDPSLPPNSNHPGGSAYFSVANPFSKVDNDNPPIDVQSGELFLMDLYNNLRNSSYWDKSLLIITYDELGGIYDHVPPPAAVNPGIINWINNSSPPFSSLPGAKDIIDKTADGFGYNAYGGRVPALVVSPFIEAGSQLISTTNYPYDHSSIVRTVLDVFGQTNTSLNDRDAAGTAPSIINSSIFNINNNNNTEMFSGTIVASPSSLTFATDLLHETVTKLLQTSAGNITLSYNSSEPWLSVTTTNDSSDNNLILNVTVNASGLSNNTYEASLTVSGEGLSSLVIPVTMIVDL